MRLLRPHTLAFASAFVLSGCGTVANFASLKPKVYGGIEKDLAFIHHGWVPSGGSGAGKAILFVGLVTIYGTELCCTALGDTVTLPLTKVLDDEWRLKEAEKPPPEPRRPAIAFGVNGPYLWEGATEGPKVSGDERPSMEVESPPPEPTPPPSGLLIEWSHLWRAEPVEPNEGGEPPPP
jgi:uncharacterized protein YceK